MIHIQLVVLSGAPFKKFRNLLDKLVIILLFQPPFHSFPHHLGLPDTVSSFYSAEIKIWKTTDLKVITQKQ
jgi:hypothetical protein